mgnify:CR=1 FL=1
MDQGESALVSNLSLYENVAVAGYVGKKRSPQEAAKRAEALLEQMNVGSAKDRFPAQVSGPLTCVSRSLS